MRRQEQRLVGSRGKILKGIENVMGGECEHLHYRCIGIYGYSHKC